MVAIHAGFTASVANRYSASAAAGSEQAQCWLVGGKGGQCPAHAQLQCARGQSSQAYEVQFNQQHTCAVPNGDAFTSQLHPHLA